MSVPAMSDPLSKAATATEIARAIAGGKVKAAAQARAMDDEKSLHAAAN